MAKAYVVERIFQSINVRGDNDKLISVNLANPAEGILGWLPVFKTKKEMEKSFGKNTKFSELEVPKLNKIKDM